MITGLIIASGILLLIVLFLLFRLQVLSSILSGSVRKRMATSDKVNAFLLLAFFIVGMILTVYSAMAYKDEMILPIASEHGVVTDNLFWLTIAIVSIAFVVTNALLFFFSFKYQYKEENRAHFYPHNNKLEMIWTVVPAIVLALLIFSGWQSWTDITSKAPEESVVVEVMGKQFAWQTRYPGADNKLGRTDYRMISDINEFGIDVNDKASNDDFIAREVHIPVGQPVLFKIRSRDVLHSVFVPHFRLKMDAVPGMPTSFWFTPTKTTEEMRIETGNPKFNYELACTEVCGRGHFAMKKLIVVETPEEFEKWKSEQKSFLSKNPELTGAVMPKVEETVELSTEESVEMDSTNNEVAVDSASMDSVMEVAEEVVETVEEMVEESEVVTEDSI